MSSETIVRLQSAGDKRGGVPQNAVRQVKLMMWWVAQVILIGVYAAMPIVAVASALIWRRRGHIRPVISLVVNCVGGLGVGTALAWANAKLLGARMPAWEIFRLIYLAISVLCVLRVVDLLLLKCVYRLLRVPVDRWGNPAGPGRWRALVGLLGQRALLLLIVVPYSIALLIAYRPRLRVEGNPGLLGLQYTPIQAFARDGMRLEGWWIEAGAMPDALLAESAERWGKRAVLLCHGVGSSKERQLELAWLLASRGYNVAVFDFRAHGESGGSFISYGDREREDVLAVAGWVKRHRTDASERIFGIGMNTGAAALLAAAAEAGEDGLFDAIVLYDPYAEFDALAAHAADRLLPWGVQWLASNIAVPLASLHAGTNLGAFSPAALAGDVWPRPSLVVHGRAMSFVPVMQGMELYQQTWFPKEQFWPGDNREAERRRMAKLRGEGAILVDMFRQYLGTQEDLSSDPGVRYRTLEFLRQAERMPVI